MYYALQNGGEENKEGETKSPWTETILTPSVNRDMLLSKLFMTVSIGFINCTESYGKFINYMD